MRRCTEAILVFMAAASAGCEADFYSRKIVQPNTEPGRVLLALSGTGEQMVKAKRIDLHRRIDGADETAIDVWVLQPAGQSPRGAVVVLHGLIESKASWPYFGTARVLAKKGYTVVLPDLRAHGRSEGQYVTYGAKEKLDVKAVMDHLASAKVIQPPFYAFGVNLGGSVAIQYAAIDPRCRGVLAIAPYQDLTTVARQRIRFLAPAMSETDFQDVLSRAGELAEIDPASASSVAAARKLKCPLLLVHGLVDLTVPMEQTKAIHDAAAGPKKLVLITTAEKIVLEDWIANSIDALAREGLPKAGGPAPPK